jgi:hypothetical protein
VPTPPLAPPELAAPTAVLAALDRGRQARIVEHGFTAAELGLDWWTTSLASVGLHDITVDLDPKPGGDGVRRLTRGGIFALAAPVARGGASQNEVLTLLVHVLVWGSGTSRRQNTKRLEAFADVAHREKRVALLHAATQAAVDGDASAAYRLLIRRGGGVIPSFGPSYFTKLLYFAGAGALEHPCAILDARVARSLRAAGWRDLPDGWANWYTETYASYCHLLRRWADAAADRLGRRVGADEFERGLFDGGRKSSAAPAVADGGFTPA